MRNWCKVNSHTLLLSSTALDDWDHLLKLKRCGSRMAPLLINPRGHHGELVFLVPSHLGYGGLEVLVPGGGKWS